MDVSLHCSEFAMISKFGGQTIMGGVVSTGDMEDVQVSVFPLASVAV